MKIKLNYKKLVGMKLINSIVYYFLAFHFHVFVCFTVFVFMMHSSLKKIILNTKQAACQTTCSSKNKHSTHFVYFFKTQSLIPTSTQSQEHYFF